VDAELSGFASAAAVPRRGLSKAVLVYEDLRASIIDLALKPGTRLDKHEICGRLGISRQPLAEAVTRLASERLVDVEPQKGTFVARIRLSDVAEASFVRRALEVATAAAIAANMDDLILKRLDRLLTYQATAIDAKDWEEFYALDVRFHSMLFERIAMARVAAAVEISRAPLERARRLLVPSPGRSQETLKEHRAIYAALAGHDAAAAGEAMGAHLDRALSEIKRFAAHQPDLFES
jgi:DNA-binding GntR family transcriptional regulator